MRLCKCPEDAQIEIGTWDDRYLMLCNCCGKDWREEPEILDSWLQPGHVCNCGDEHNGQ